MKLSDKIAISGVIVAIISIVITFIKDKENSNKALETNSTSQITYGNQSPNIINNKGNINVQ